MAVLKVTVTYGDGKVLDVKITPKVQLAFERQYGMGLPKAGQDMHNEYMYYLAWKALQFSGQETRDFEDFVDSLEDIVPVREKENPTQLERSPDS